MSPRNVSFVESVAKINRNIVHLKPRNYILIRTYIESAKESDASYTGSSVMTPVLFSHYRQLISKYPDLDIKCCLVAPYEEEYDGDRKCHLASHRDL